MLKASIVVINYNGKEFIIECLKALERQAFKDFEVIVVDNNSADNSLYEIRSFLKGSPLTTLVKLIPLDRNLGFTGGNIVGLKHANADSKYIALLNPDANADSYWLQELIKAMESYPEVGICASKMIVYGTDVIDSAGDGYATLLKGFKQGEGDNSERFNRQEYVFGACAGAALYRRKMLDEIGFFDEDFFLIHEDTDLNFRAQLSGWKVLYVPRAIVCHKVRSSIGHMSDTAIYYTLRNSECVWIKNLPLLVFIRCLPGFIVRMITEFIYFAIKHKRLRLYFRAKVDVLRALPGMLKKRAVLMKNRKVTNGYLISIMTSVWRKDFLRAKIKKFIYG